MSSKYGRNCSKCPMSVNSIGINVGHQQIAKFLLSMLLSFEFSDTLNKEIVSDSSTQIIDGFAQLPHKVLKDVFQN